MDLQEKEVRDILKNIPGQTSDRQMKCPESETLLQAVEGKLSRKEKFAIIDHVFKCPQCLRKFQAIKEFRAAGRSLVKDKEKIELAEEEVKELMFIAGGKTRPPSEGRTSLSGKIARMSVFTRSSYKYLSLLAASVIIIIGLLLVFQESTPLGDGNIRGIRIGKAQLISPKGDYRQIPVKFEWKPVENAQEYQVKLYDEELTPVWTSSKIQSSTCMLPDEIFKKLRSNTPYFWKILVFLENGEQDKSPLQDFKFMN